MKVLFVLDMQEEYVGLNRNKKIYNYDTDKLINLINSKIMQYSAEGNVVVYIKNKFFWQAKFSDFVKGLDVVSNFIFEKKRPSCFSNNSLIKFLKDKDISSIEMVGVDGNYCVGKSALEGSSIGLEVLLSLSGVGISNKVKFIKMKHKLVNAGVKLDEK